MEDDRWEADTRTKWVSVVSVCFLVTAGFLGFVTFESDDMSAGNIIYVDDSGGADYTTIQEGIDAANPGDTVYVYNGTYYENVIVNKTINLTGENRDTTVIDAFENGSAVYISADWVNITGFTVQHPKTDIYKGGIVLDKVQNCRVIDNKPFHGVGGSGIFLNYSDCNYLAGNNGTQYINPINGFGGIFLYYSNDNIIIDNTFFYWLIGIRLDYSNNNTITDNNLCYNAGGIGIRFSSNNTIEDNTIITNRTWLDSCGVLVEFCNYGYNTIVNNTIIGNGISSDNIGIWLWYSSDGYNTFVGNNISSTKYGIYIRQSSSYNTFIGSGTSSNMYGIFISQSSHNNFIENSIFDNNYSVYMEQQSGDNNFINCSLSNATQDDFNITDDSHAIVLNTTFDKTSVYYGDTLSTLTVKWFTHVHVMYYNGTPASNADIWINDTVGAPMFYGRADSQGWINWFVAIEYMERDLGGDHIGDKFYRTPHHVTATDGKLWGYADPFMDKSKTVTIILGNYTSLYLYPGWNLVSLPRIQTYPDLDTVLGPIDGDYDAVQWFDIADEKDQWKHHHISKPQELNDLKDIYHTMGFWIHVTDPNGTTLTVYGDLFSFSQPISLNVGWNQVGFPSLSNKTTAAALNNLIYGVEVDAIFTFDAATQTWNEVGPGDNFILGKGYWMHATQDCVWEVPL